MFDHMETSPLSPKQKINPLFTIKYSLILSGNLLSVSFHDFKFPSRVFCSELLLNKPMLNRNSNIGLVVRIFFLNIQPANPLFIYLFIYLFVRLFTYLFIYLFIYLWYFQLPIRHVYPFQFQSARIACMQSKQSCPRTF